MNKRQKKKKLKKELGNINWYQVHTILDMIPKEFDMILSHRRKEEIE